MQGSLSGRRPLYISCIIVERLNNCKKKFFRARAAAEIVTRFCRRVSQRRRLFTGDKKTKRSGRQKFFCRISEGRPSARPLRGLAQDD
jgi:hypothetical protein